MPASRGRAPSWPRVDGGNRAIWHESLPRPTAARRAGASDDPRRASRESLRSRVGLLPTSTGGNDGILTACVSPGCCDGHCWRALSFPLDARAAEPRSGGRRPRPEDVQLKTKDGLHLHDGLLCRQRRFYGAMKNSVPIILLHAYKGDCHDFDDLALRCKSRGMR